MLKNLQCYILIIGTLCCAQCLAWLAYPPSSTHGIFAAVAVPLEIPHHNVFVSYNFEANYILPEIWGIPPIYKGGEPGEEFETTRKIQLKSAACLTNCTAEAEVEGSAAGSQEEQEATTEPSPSDEFTEAAPPRERRALLTRTNIYQIFKDKFKKSGFQGETCLLRLICEISATELGEVNGVLGSLMHVIFSPSTSEAEQLPLRYYQAEHDGWHDQCHYYEAHCGESFLDLISQPFHKILQLIEGNHWH